MLPTLLVSTPAALGIDAAAERVHHGVEIGADPEPVQGDVVGGVHHDRDLGVRKGLAGRRPRSGSRRRRRPRSPPASRQCFRFRSRLRPRPITLTGWRSCAAGGNRWPSRCSSPPASGCSPGSSPSRCWRPTTGTDRLRLRPCSRAVGPPTRCCCWRPRPWRRGACCRRPRPSGRTIAALALIETVAAILVSLVFGLMGLTSDAVGRGIEFVQLLAALALPAVAAALLLALLRSAPVTSSYPLQHEQALPRLPMPDQLRRPPLRPLCRPAGSPSRPPGMVWQTAGEAAAGAPPTGWTSPVKRHGNRRVGSRFPAPGTNRTRIGPHSRQRLDFRVLTGM